MSAAKWGSQVCLGYRHDSGNKVRTDRRCCLQQCRRSLYPLCHGAGLCRLERSRWHHYTHGRCGNQRIPHAGSIPEHFHSRHGSGCSRRHCAGRSWKTSTLYLLSRHFRCDRMYSLILPPGSFAGAHPLRLNEAHGSSHKRLLQRLCRAYAARDQSPSSSRCCSRSSGW